MLNVKGGLIADGRVISRLYPQLAHGTLGQVSAIVLHQTGAGTGASTLSKYSSGSGVGAHFLIDKDGTIYQTAPINKKTWHVGMIRSRCIETHSCTPDEAKFEKELAKASRGHYTDRYVPKVNAHELRKTYPQRFPFNGDSIGIEIVGGIADRKNGTFEKLMPEQRTSSEWLIKELLDALGLKRTDVYRHPEVSYKLKGEAADASW